MIGQERLHFNNSETNKNIHLLLSIKCTENNVGWLFNVLLSPPKCNVSIVVGLGAVVGGFDAASEKEKRQINIRISH